MSGFVTGGGGGSTGGTGGGGGGVIAPGSITPDMLSDDVPIAETTSTLTVTVSTTGSDTPSTDRPARLSGGDYSAHPFLTIQAALDSLPRDIRHLTTVHVGAGTFAGAVIDGFVSGLAAEDDHPLLRITGTMVLASVTTGPNTGTATGGSSSTLVHTGAGWTVNDLTGKLVRLVSGNGSAANSPAAQLATVLGRVLSNTSDTITLQGTFQKLPRQDMFNAMYPDPSGTPGAGTVYELVEPASTVGLETVIASRAVCFESACEMLELDSLSIGASGQVAAFRAVGKHDLIVMFNSFPVATGWSQIDVSGILGGSLRFNHITGGGRPVFAQHLGGFFMVEYNRIENATGPVDIVESQGISVAVNANRFLSCASPAIHSIGSIGHLVGNVFDSCLGPIIDLTYAALPAEFLGNSGTSLPAVCTSVTRCANTTYDTTQALNIRIDGTLYTPAELAAYDGVKTRYSLVMPAV